MPKRHELEAAAWTLFVAALVVVATAGSLWINTTFSAAKDVGEAQRLLAEADRLLSADINWPSDELAASIEQEGHRLDSLVGRPGLRKGPAVSAVTAASKRLNALLAEFRSRTASQRESSDRLGRTVAALKSLLGSDERAPLTDHRAFWSGIGKVAWQLIGVIALIAILAWFLSAEDALGALRRKLSPVEEMEGFGFRLRFSSEAQDQAETVFKRYRAQVDAQCMKFNERMGISESLGKVVDQVRAIAPTATQLRSALYVPDLLFSDHLYQLTDYVPSGGWRGLTFTIRYGVIGIAWRSMKAHKSKDVPFDVAKLIADWQLTSDEARKAADWKKVFVGVPLLDEVGRPLGVIYFDSPSPSAFSELSIEVMAEAIVEACSKTGIIGSLKAYRDELLAGAHPIRIHSASIIT